MCESRPGLEEPAKSRLIEVGCFAHCRGDQETQ